jgi:hypothetical protein
VPGIAFAALAMMQPVTCKAQSSDKKDPTPVEGGEIVNLIAPLKDAKREISKKIILSRETRLLITVNLSGRFNYRIKFDEPNADVDPR